jgi:RimJ/RimL family protein N-acetyltransferase
VLPRLSYPDPALTDGVVELRAWTYDDIACIEAASHDPRIPAGTTVPAAYTDEEGRAFIERQWGRRDNGEGLSLAIADSARSEACGLIVLLHRADPSVLGLGYWVVPESREKGLASRAVGLLASWALTQPSIAEVEAIVEADNEPSRRVLEKAGLVRVQAKEIDGRAAWRLVRTR